MKYQTAITASTLALSFVQAAPAAKLHNLKLVKRADTTVPFFYPEPIAHTYTFTPGESLGHLSDAETIKMGQDQLKQELGLGDNDLEIVQTYKDAAGVMHIYAQQVVNGVSVVNHDCAIHIKDGQVIAMSSSFNSGDSLVAPAVAAPTIVVSLAEAVTTAEKQLGVSRDTFPAKKVYLRLPSGDLAYTHQFQLRDKKAHKWFQVSVDAANGQVVQVVNFVRQARYNVLKFPKVEPKDGFEVVVNPAFKGSSPEGWHSDGEKSYTDTQGNNIDSHVADYRPDGGDALNFKTSFDAKSEPTTEENKNTAIINNFYVTNMMHDISYQFGFTEAAGNFQDKNFGKGGDEGDRVIVNNQAPGTDNADFSTPPDGQQPTMNMYAWDMSTPMRDGSLENSIPMHEYTHGITNRMTGGSRNGECLENLEAGGMGEGWSDAFALFVGRKPADTRETDVIIGAYVYNKPAGIRSFPYSTNLETNPLVFNKLVELNEVHDMGELWTSIWNEIYWNLVDKSGYSGNWFDSKQSEGNIVAMQLMMGGLTLQPCNPSFLQARDAVLAADDAFYGGDNKCEVWKGFAKRGMGNDAVAEGYVNGFSVPEECVTK